MCRTWAGGGPLGWPDPARAMRSSGRFQSSLRRITNSSALISSENNRMEQPLPDTELVVATPERVSFDYQVAGLGTRAIAQLLDLLVILGILIALAFAAYGVAAPTNSAILPDLMLIIGPFVIILGYFWTSEAMW